MPPVEPEDMAPLAGDQLANARTPAMRGETHRGEPHRARGRCLRPREVRPDQRAPGSLRRAFDYPYEPGFQLTEPCERSVPNEQAERGICPATALRGEHTVRVQAAMRLFVVTGFCFLNLVL